jgi:WD40 repeat protein
MNNSNYRQVGQFNNGGHLGSVRALAVVPTTGKLIDGGGNSDPAIRIWDIARSNAKPLFEGTGRECFLWCCCRMGN